MHRIVVHSLEETRDRELLRAARPQTGDHADAAFYEAGNLALPLVLERGRANHQHAIHVQFVSHDLGRSERLDGLAEPPSRRRLANAPPAPQTAPRRAGSHTWKSSADS